MYGRHAVADLSSVGVRLHHGGPLLLSNCAKDALLRPEPTNPRDERTVHPTAPDVRL